MTKEKQLALRKPNAQGKCLYDRNSVIIIELSAILSLPFFLLAGNDASDGRPYALCAAAAVAAMILAVHMRGLPIIIREIPIFLYAAFHVAGACLSFDRVQAVTMPVLILNTLRAAAGIAMAVFALAMSVWKDPARLYRDWCAIGNACMLIIIFDGAIWLTACLTQNSDALMGAGLYELSIRVFGEFWLSAAVLISIQPQCLTINYRNVNRLMWDLLRVTLWTSLILVALTLVVLKETINVRPLVWCVAMLDAETLVLIWAYRKARADSRLSHQASKNYVKLFCARRWFYTCQEVAEVLDIQQRLEQIKAEREFLEKGPFTDYTVGRLYVLNIEEWDLIMRLEQYALPVQFPAGSQDG